jgi:hypothetical protein
MPMEMKGRRVWSAYLENLHGEDFPHTGECVLQINPQISIAYTKRRLHTEKTNVAD